eukprot:g3354.t1
MDFENLSRRALQALAKEKNIRANQTSRAIIKALQDLHGKSNAGKVKQNSIEDETQKEKQSIQTTKENNNTENSEPNVVAVEKQSSFSKMSRRELQKLAKKEGIRANQKSATLIAALEAVCLNLNTLSLGDDGSDSNDKEKPEEEAIQAQEEKKEKVQVCEGKEMKVAQSSNQEEEVLNVPIRGEKKAKAVISTSLNASPTTPVSKASTTSSTSFERRLLGKTTERQINTLSGYDLNGRRTGKTARKREKINWERIHQKQFKKMENLHEHAARKTQEAKNLLSSFQPLRKEKSDRPITLTKEVNIIKSKKMKHVKVQKKKNRLFSKSADRCKVPLRTKQKPAKKI